MLLPVCFRPRQLRCDWGACLVATPRGGERRQTTNVALPKIFFVKLSIPPVKLFVSCTSTIGLCLTGARVFFSRIGCKGAIFFFFRSIWLAGRHVKRIHSITTVGCDAQLYHPGTSFFKPYGGLWLDSFDMIRPQLEATPIGRSVPHVAVDSTQTRVDYVTGNVIRLLCVRLLPAYRRHMPCAAILSARHFICRAANMILTVSCVSTLARDCHGKKQLLLLHRCRQTENKCCRRWR